MARAGQYLANAIRAGKGKPPQQMVLLAIFLDSYLLGVTPDGDPFAADYDVPGVAVPLRGRNGLRQRLASDMWAITGQMPSQEAQSTVIGVIEGMAGQKRTRHRPAVRVAPGP